MLSDKVPYYILDLLQQTPSVYVEGLGRFEAIFHPALIDIPQSSIKPPYVEPGFRDDPESPNQTLAAYIRYVSGEEAGSPEEAITGFVRQVWENTADGNVYPIEKFGTFSRSSASTIRFTPDWDAFNLSFSGLEVIKVKKEMEPATRPATYFPPPDIVTPVSVPAEVNIAAETESAIAENGTTESISQEEKTSRQERIDESTTRLWWIILTSALVLIAVLCAYLAWDILSSRSALNEIKQIHSDTVATTMTDGGITPVDTVPEEEAALTDAGNNVLEEIPDQKVIPENTGSVCYVVVGAFTDVANVTRMTERLTSLGYNSELIKGGSLTRVAIRTSCDQPVLQQMLNDARATINPEAWIY